MLPPSRHHLAFRKRDKSPALQDASASTKRPRGSARFWSAPLLRRFSVARLISERLPASRHHLAFRKRDKSPALQDASASAKRHRGSARFWSAAPLRRFSVARSISELLPASRHHLAFRKRDKSPALQDASASTKRPRGSARFWSAAPLRRFSVARLISELLPASRHHIAFRKRDKSPALQDASASAQRHRGSARFWSAAPLRRFSVARLISELLTWPRICKPS